MERPDPLVTAAPAARARGQRRPLRRPARLAACLLLLLSLALAAALLVPLGRRVPFRPADSGSGGGNGDGGGGTHAEAVARIRDGRLVPGPGGLVALPPRLAGLSATGFAYCARDERGRRLVFFPSWVGRERLLGPFQDDLWLEGFLFAEAEAQAEAQAEAEAQAGAGASAGAAGEGRRARRRPVAAALPDGPTSWSLVGPALGPPWRARGDRRTARHTLTRVEALGGGWFYVDAFS